jgi:hypothetical protein
MVRTVCRWHVTAQARVQAGVSPCEICDGQSGIGTGFSPSYPVFPCQYFSTIFLHTHNTWGLNNRLVGGRGSESYSHPIDMNNNDSVL